MATLGGGEAGLRETLRGTGAQRRFLNIGGLSLALFAINVSAIFAVSVALFRFKGIRPIRRQLLNWEVRGAPWPFPTLLWLLRAERAHVSPVLGIHGP